jgi:hypothetical protein
MTDLGDSVVYNRSDRILASHHTDFGPDEWRLNRIGVTPDVVVTPTPADEAA